MSDVMSYLTVDCQAVIAVTFGTSTAAKVTGRAAYADFQHWLSASAGVPSRLAPPIAVVAVAAEAATAVAMVVPPLVPAGFVVATVLLIVLTASVRSMIRRRVKVPCRCFGAGRHPPGTAHLARNLSLLVAAAGGLVMTTASAGPAPLGSPWVLAATAGVACALLLINLEEIVTLARPVNPGPRPRPREETP